MKRHLQTIPGFGTIKAFAATAMLCTILILAASFAGCTQENSSCNAPAIAPDGSFRTRIELALSGDAVIVPQPRGVEDEKAATDLWVLQFNVSNPTGTLVRTEYLTEVTVSGGKLRAEATLTAGDKMQLVLVANTHDPDLYATAKLPANSTLAQFEAIPIPVAALRGTGLPTDDSETLPMSGRTDPAGISLPVTGNIVTLTIRYAIAKLALSLDLTKLPEGATFTPRNATLRRVPKTISLGEVAPDAITPAAEAANFTDYEAIPIVDGFPSQFTWYMAANQRGKGSATSPRKKTDETAPAGEGEYCSYIEVTGDYRDNPEAATTEVIYRLWPGENNTDDYNITAGTSYELAIVPLGASLADSRVKAYTDFGFGMADSDGEHDGETVWGPINLSENGSANSYIVSKANNCYKFDARVKGNGKATLTVNDPDVWSSQRDRINPDDDLIAPKPLVPASAFVIWSTGNSLNAIIKDVKVKRGYVYFTTTGAKGDALTAGNALIGVKDASGTLIWSWHIWANDYDPATEDVPYTTRALVGDGNEGQGGIIPTSSRSFTMMGRNLGALNNTPGSPESLGLQYQWGRKDPFPSAKTTTTTTTDESTPFTESYPTKNASGYSWMVAQGNSTGSGADASIAYAIQNPTRWIMYANTRIADWLNVSGYVDQRDYLWGNPNPTDKKPNILAGSKSIYDPCPPGYRVPRADSWTSFSTDNIGNDGSANATTDRFDDGTGFYFYCNPDNSVSSYYPAAGMRLDGKLYSVARYGYYWLSSSAYSNHRALFLNFNWVGSIDVLDSHSRTRALSVRCAREE